MNAVKSIAVAIVLLSVGCEMHPPVREKTPAVEPNDAATNNVPEFFPGQK